MGSATKTGALKIPMFDKVRQGASVLSVSLPFAVFKSLKRKIRL
ncbi:MAG: hypothetical protein ABFS35_18810 [Bacteroidota bacterium]